MNTDKACEILSRVEHSTREHPIRITDLTELKEVCNFAISRMREFDSLKKMLRGIVAEFKEEQT